MPNLISASATPVGITQRKLIAGIVAMTLLAFVGTVVDLAIGGRPDPPSLRAAATLLNGQWRFHTGDDLRWADTNTDDSGWETIDMTAVQGSHDGDVGLPDYVDGWTAHGHAGYHGYAWYRRVVMVPSGAASWDILGPTLVEDGYELYWNGRLLGGSGRIGSNPRVVVTRPLRFALPAGAAGSRGVLAIRAFMLPKSGGSTTGGGMHTPPILAPRPVSDAIHSVQWRRTIAGYLVDALEPLAMIAVMALAIAYWRCSNYKGFLTFACVALALTAERRLNNAIVAWTDLEALPTYAWLASVMWAPTVAAWTWAWNRGCQRPWRSIDLLAALLGVAGIVSSLIHSANATKGIRFASIALFVIIGARITRSGSLRVLALATMASIMAALFGGELLDPIGVPGIWFPFGIGVSRTQYIYAIAIPLVAILIARTVGLERKDA